MELKSTGVLKDKLDYDKVTIIKQLGVTREALALHQKRLAELFKKDTPDQIQRKVMDIIMRDNAFANIMQNVVEKAFVFNIDEEDVKKMIEATKKNIEQNREEALSKAPEEEKAKFTKLEDHPFFKLPEDQQRNYAIAMIKKELIYRELAKLWDIFVTDDEVKQQLENFYKFSNVSIREYLNKPERFEAVRQMILAEKISKEVLNRFRVKWELQPPAPQPKPEEKKEEKKEETK